jgi:putative two-component system response regulator
MIYAINEDEKLPVDRCSRKDTFSMRDEIRILSVDDFNANLVLIKSILSEAGSFEFLEASNGKEALATLFHTPDIDIVLLDLEMPVMNGMETLRHIKEHEKTRDIPVIVVTSNKSEVHKTLALGANDFISKPYDHEELKLRVLNHVRAKKLNDLSRDMNRILETEVVKKTSYLQDALALAREAEYEISLRLGRAAEFRDLETGMHIRRISELSTQLARLAGLSERRCEILRYAAPLHDVGKIGIPDNILLKPGKLDEQEFSIMKTHTLIGAKILTGADKFTVMKAGKLIALQHHEKWDGTGYPSGLSGKDIHPYGRITIIVDIFDALTSDRPYKKAMPVDEAVPILEDGRGSFFDPELLDIFLDNLEVFRKIKEEYVDICEGDTRQ